MSSTAMWARLGASAEALGDGAATLTCGPFRIRLGGLPRPLHSALERRFGPFFGLEPTPGFDRGEHWISLEDAGGSPWLGGWRRATPYLLEPLEGGEDVAVASHHFALARLRGTTAWRLSITDTELEPQERIVDNAVRYVVARLAAESSGFAMHAGGVLRDGRAYLFAGPSRSGKTTAVRRAAPARSLGDDFAFVLPGAGGFVTAALPFDNAETIRDAPPTGPLPVAGIWRLHRATVTRTEAPPPGRAVASLLACVAFPWAMPDLQERLLDGVGAFVGAAHFRHLHFALGDDLWSSLEF